MSKSKKRNVSNGQKSPYKIIPQTGYEGRHLFKAASLMAAVGLALSAVISTMPQTVCNVTTLSIDGESAPAYVGDISEVESFYTKTGLNNFDIPKTVTATEISSASMLNDVDFSDYVSKISDDEAADKLFKAKITAVEGYTRLNSSGIPMSEMTTPDWMTFDENGIPTNYSYCISGKSTAYYSGYITSTGTTPQQGTVAVDPRLIPYGTEMWITSADGKYVYGYARAEDTGGFIYFENGAKVDLYMHSYDDCVNWGWRGANIYIF